MARIYLTDGTNRFLNTSREGVSSRSDGEDTLFETKNGTFILQRAQSVDLITADAASAWLNSTDAASDDRTGELI
jgi:hypothetical protein